MSNERKNRLGNTVNRLIALIVVSAILLLAACAEEPPPTGQTQNTTPSPAPTLESARITPTLAAISSAICAPGSPPGYISEVVLAKNTEGDNFSPVEVTDEFSPDQATFHAVVTLVDAPANISLRAAWFLLRATGYTPDTKIDESTLNVAQPGSRNVEFTLRSTQDKWPPGLYCVEIYSEGNLALSRQFTVTGENTSSNASAGVIKDVVLAEETEPGTFEPVNPTTTFSTDTDFIHAVVQIENAPPSTVFRARWYPPGQEPLDFELTTDGTRWMDFRLTPPPEGFPAGDYRVEIYVNGEKADERFFIVR